MNREYPLIEYAHKIGKNTAEFTVNDLAAYMKWWIKQPVREDILEATAAQRKVYEADVVGMKKWREDEKMAKSYATKKYQDAQMSRLAEQGIESPINDGKEEIVIHADEIVCSMELTKIDIMALKWALERIFVDYELNNDDDYGASLMSLKKGLEGV